MGAKNPVAFADVSRDCNCWRFLTDDKVARALDYAFAKLIADFLFCAANFDKLT
jgi:hypothetical protein